jgi:hypothetical protein
MLEASVVFTGIFYTAIIVIASLQYKYCRRIGEPLSWIVVGIHGLAYCAGFLITYGHGDFNRFVYNYWSIMLRVHTLATLLSIEVMRLIRIRMRGVHGC